MGSYYLGNRERLCGHGSLCLSMDCRFHQTLLCSEVAMKTGTAAAILLIATLFSHVGQAEPADPAIAHAIFYVR
jgi:hypothetical protein